MANKSNKNWGFSTRGGETVTPERQRKGGIVAEDIAGDDGNKVAIKRYRAIAECVLDSYFLREKLTEAQYEAGMKFRDAYLRAVLRVNIGYVSAGCHGATDIAAILPIQSEELLRSAYGVLSAEQKSVVINVCGHDHWAGDKARLKTLGRGLERLARLWRTV